MNVVVISIEIFCLRRETVSQSQRGGGGGRLSIQSSLFFTHNLLINKYCFQRMLNINFYIQVFFCSGFLEVKIRLVNSTTSKNNTGRIEVYHASFGWGTVCDYGWDDVESDVVCRQLGFTGANVTRARAYCGQGSGPILLDNVRCTGSESYIWDCIHLGWNKHYCGHHEDVGVECY